MAYLLGTQEEPFTNGELIKLCLIASAEEMRLDKINARLCLSTTAAQRVEDTGGSISSQFKNKANDFGWFSSALNESTDVTDIMQSLAVIGRVSAKFE